MHGNWTRSFTSPWNAYSLLKLSMRAASPGRYPRVTGMILPEPSRISPETGANNCQSSDGIERTLGPAFILTSTILTSFASISATNPALP